MQKKITLIKDGQSRQFILGSPSIDQIVRKLMAAGWRKDGAAVNARDKTGQPKPEVKVIELEPHKFVRRNDVPLVSVIMPAWNAAKFISRSIQSMKEQSLADWELCVCDDGSDDETFATAIGASAGDRRIKVSRIPHGGYAIATNCALCMASGDVIARLDADDRQHPDRLAFQAQFLLSHPDVDCVTCDMTDIGLSDELLKAHATGPMDGERYLAGWGGPCHASVVAWRRVYDVIGGFSPDEEWDGDGGWNCRAIKAGMKWGHIDSPWYYHRRYPEMRSEKFRDLQNGMHVDLLRKYGLASV